MIILDTDNDGKTQFIFHNSSLSLWMSLFLLDLLSYCTGLSQTEAAPGVTAAVIAVGVVVATRWPWLREILRKSQDVFNVGKITHRRRVLPRH